MEQVETVTINPAQRRLSQLSRMTGPSHTLTSKGDTTIDKNTGEGGSHMEEETQRDSYVTDSAKPENSEDVPYPLTDYEARQFVKTKLKIPDPEALIMKDRMTFLNCLVDRLNRAVPFTNMAFFSSTPIWKSTTEDKKKDMLSCQGGTCSWINPFTKALLDHFGYKTHHVCGYNPGQSVHDTHLAVIVEDVTHPGSRHLVEPGTRRPLCAAIPLDFEKESPTYKFHYLKNKFFKEGEKLIWCSEMLTKRTNGYVRYDSAGCPWQVQLTYNLSERRNWLPFTKIWNEFFSISPYHKFPPFNGLVFFAYLSEDQIVSVMAYKDNIVVYLFDQGDSYQRASMTKAELMQMLLENFPQYSAEKLKEVFELCPFS